MTQDNPVPFGPGQAERPTWQAELRITSEQVQAGTITRRWGTAEGMVPTDQVNHLVTTFGIAANIVTGIAGAVVTLRLAPGLTVIALAELALALTGAGLIALCSRAYRRRPAGQPQDDPGNARRAG
jgi:uncharacterized membrane protein YeaQ/YmgE (transglycosylase-associated protein family)